MIVLPCAAGAVVVFTAVWFVWQARRVWLYGQPKPLRASVTVVVARACQSPSEIPESQRRAETAGGSASLEGVRVICGQVEYGSLPPSRPIGAETLGREVESRWRRPQRSEDVRP